MKTEKNILVISVVVAVVLLALLFSLKVMLKPKEIKLEEVKPKQIVKAKVAIVIDDWGYNLRGIDFLKEIKQPITISILPNLKYSSKVAEIAKAQGKEVILHLPLEPETDEREIRLERHTLTAKMSDEEIIRDLQLCFSSVPYIVGVSNHMGSKATQDKRLVSIIFSELKKRALFFLDNLVTNKSVCSLLAKDVQIKFVSRDFFLDNLNEEEYIKNQLKKLSEFALSVGEATAVGHAGPTTLKVLKEEIPLMQEEGIKFIFVSDLAK